MAVVDNTSLYTILLDGAKLDEELASQVREVRVVDSLKLPDLCTLKIGLNKTKRKIKEKRGKLKAVETETLDEMPFEINQGIEIKLGGLDDRETVSIFKGEITTLEPAFSGGGVQLLVRAYDRSHRLHRSRVLETYSEMSAADIVDKICKRNNLSLESDGGTPVFAYMLQENETDWDFIWRLAIRCGREFLVNDTKASFKKPAAGTEIELEYGKALNAFTPRLTAAQQVQNVTLHAFDPKSKSTIQADVSSPNQYASVGIDRSNIVPGENPGTIHIATEPVKTQAEANAVAQSMLDSLANGYVGCWGAMLGDPRLRAGVKVKITKVGEKFSGTYRVATSTHILRGGGGYVTEFSSESLTVGAATGGTNGRPMVRDQLMIGLVTDNQDPDGMGRVKVRLPALDDSVESEWARICVPSSGAERGLAMLPVNGEEVIVAFEHGDSTRPIVIGSVFNGVDKPGEELASTDGSYAMRSDKKAYFRSKQDMFISSDGPLTIEIKGEVKETFSDKHKTTVTKAYEVEASEIKITAKMGDVVVKGVNITVESQANLDIKAGAMLNMSGTAGVNIKTSAITNIGGSMINIG